MSNEELIQYLKMRNNALDKTLEKNFICDKIVKNLPLYVIEYCALFKEAQVALLDAPESVIKVISSIVKYSEATGQDWVPNAVNFVHLCSNGRYTDLISDVKENGLDDELIPAFLFLTKNGGNFFNVKSLEDVRNIDVLRQNKLNEFNQTRDPNVLLLNKYGISYDDAYELYKRYGKDVLKIESSTEQQFLLDIKNIIEGRGTEEKQCFDYDFSVNIDSRLRNMFAKIYSDSLFKISNESLMGYYTDNGNNIAVYDAGVDFTMSIYSYGYATDLSTPSNFKDEWVKPNISVDYLCNSIISGVSMKTKVKHCVYGFSNLAPNDIELLAPNDLGSGGVYHNLNVTNPFYNYKLGSDVEFRVPEELFNNTRFTNNEVFRKRRRIENGKLERVMPDYIVYFKTMDDFKNDPIWLESVQAANDFGVPIVMIDCKKTLEHNLRRLDGMIQSFEQRYDNVDIVRNIIEFIYSLRNGYRFDENLFNQYLNDNNVNDIVIRVVSHLEEIGKMAPSVAIAGIDLFLSVIDEEFEKIFKSRKWVEKAVDDGHVVEKPENVIAYLKMLKQKIIQNYNLNDNKYHELKMN